MTGIIAARRNVAGFGIFTLVMVAVFVGLGLWQLQRRVEKHALIAALTERLAAAPGALPQASQWNALTPERDEFRRVRFAATYLPAADAMVYSSGSAVRDDVTGPGTWAFMPATLPAGGNCRDQHRLRAEHDAGPRPAGSRGDAAGHAAAGDIVGLHPFP